jgi:hypothetical protein
LRRRSSLPWPWLYDSGVVLLAVSAAARLTSVFAPARLALAVSGVSGFVAFAGLAAVGTCVFSALARGRRARRSAPGLLLPLSPRPS